MLRHVFDCVSLHRLTELPQARSLPKRRMAIQACFSERAQANGRHKKSANARDLAVCSLVKDLRA